MKVEIKETTKLFIKNHKCKLCVCTYCFHKKDCSYKKYRCNYMCSFMPHITCGSKGVFGITRLNLS